MRKTIAAAITVALVAGLLLLVGPGASATHSVGHLVRQVERLENQVGDLRRDVKVLMVDVFGCTFPGDPLTTFVDGSQGYSLYYDPACVVLAGARDGGAGPARVERKAG